MTPRHAVFLDASERGRVLVARAERDPAGAWRTRWLEVAETALDTGLPGLLRTALGGAGPAGIDAVAVTMGPGSYAGVRAAAAAAAGLSAALGVPLFGLSSLELAAGAAPPGTAPVWAAIDAGRGRLYVGQVAVDPLSGLPSARTEPEAVEAPWSPPDGGRVVRLADADLELASRAVELAVAVATGRPPLDLSTAEPVTVRSVRPPERRV